MRRSSALIQVAHTGLALPALLLSACASPASVSSSAGTTAGSVATTGRIERGPRNLRLFQPEHQQVRADPVATDLRALLEDLGPDAPAWYQHVQALASPYFEGRASGGAGAVRAADYIEFFFRRAGLQPVAGSHRQSFTFGEGVRAENVFAALPGAGALSDEWVLVTAHYDHNGYGRFGLDPTDGPLYPGADDNASGVAGLLVLADRFSARARNPDGPRRSLLFVAFDGEEQGLHGSRHFVGHTPIDLAAIDLVMNLDMIGRLRSDSVLLLGADSMDDFRTLLTPHAMQSGLRVAVADQGSGRSDDVNFTRAGVPAIHVFTGMHEEYTTPKDQAWTVNPSGAMKVLGLVEGVVRERVERTE